MSRSITHAIVLGLFLVCRAGAQAADSPPILKDRPDADAPSAPARLGAVFQSLSAGIAFRGPDDCKEIRRGLPADEIVHFVNEPKRWLLKVARLQLDKPVPLIIYKDAKGNDQPGMLQMSIDSLKHEYPGVELLRDDVLPIGEVNAGVLAARYHRGLQTFLQQQAVVRVSDRTYFVLTFTSPAPRTGDIAQDPGVREAVEMFNAIVDSVRLLDQSELKLDQDQRLYRTRSLFLNVNENRLRDALINQQWLRLIRDGQDIGYMYVVEEVAPDLPRRPSVAPGRKPTTSQGVLVGMRSRTQPDLGVQIDAESWMWMSFDRRHEKWSSIATSISGDKREVLSEFGASDIEMNRMLARDGLGGEVRSDGTLDAKQPPVRSEESYTLNVTHFSKTSTAQPVQRDLPVFYLPRALGHLLPRMVPRFEPKGYMFATYVTEQREVMARYVDVGREEEVTLGGQRVRAIPIRDRIGLEGPASVHYVSPEGRYLGSVDPESRISILPTDAATLEKIWKDANLTRPADVEEKK